jgi:hypothetical protein
MEGSRYTYEGMPSFNLEVESEARDGVGVAMLLSRKLQ